MSVLHDLRQAGRILRKSPATAIVVIATSALGICAVTTVFSVLDAFLLKPLPAVTRQAELVNVHATAPDGSSFHSVSRETWKDLRASRAALSDLAAFTSRFVSLSGGGDPSLAVAQIVTGNTFSLLGVRPALGRFFRPSEDEAPGRDPVVVLSDRVWRNRFAADPQVLGRTVLINGHPFTVIGVAPAGFVGTFLGQPFDLWVPTMMAPALGIASERLTDRRVVWLELVGRRRPEASLAAVRRELAAQASRLQHAYPDIYKGVGYEVLPTTGFEDSMRGPARGFFALLMGLSALVLAIAGVNVSGLLLARAVGRERELSIRQALGAGRGRLMRQLLFEIILLFLAGGSAGFVLTQATTSLLERFEIPTPVPLSFDLHPGPRVFLFALLCSLVGGLLFGLAGTLPATRPSALASLRARVTTDQRSTSRLRSAFVAGQVGMSALLLVVAGLFFRTVHNAARANPGFDPDGLTMTTLDLKMLGADAARAGASFEAIVARVAALPGVASATTTGLLPLGPGNRSDTVSLPGAPPEEASVSVDFSDVGDAYFATVKLPLLSGRSFDRVDTLGAPVAIVNQTLARRLWPGREPLGRTLLWNGRSLTVVGVAKDAKYRRLWEEARGFLYLSERQFGSLRRDLLVRGGGDPRELAEALRREIRAVEPNLPTSVVMPVRRYIGFSLLPQRVVSAVAGALGAVGLLLAALGLAAQVAFSVSRRTREIGIRLSLGARPRDVVRGEISRGSKTAAVGLVIGLAAALGVSRLLATLLFGIGSADPLTFGGVALLLAVMDLAAAYLPARRAARVDPLRALRCE
ncbi:MAG TPA: ABC transporter permease [Thermoanaerobaculia bacterium]|nr:ABC transporter permease [Thermoanaerobaculia bacterium]